MLTEYEFQGIKFEWDSHKADTNFQKHGISFDTACEAFFDPFVQSADVEEVDDEEFREAIIRNDRYLEAFICCLYYSKRRKVSHYFGKASHQK